MKFDIKNVGKTIIGNIIFIAVTCYIIFQSSRNTGAAIETERASFVERQDKIEVNGYIFRNEELIMLYGGQNVNYLIGSGEKVGKNQSVAQINVNSYDLSLQTQIDEIDKKIAILERSNINLAYVKTTLEKLEKDANDLYMNMMKNLQAGNIKSTAKDRDELLITLNKKQLMTQDMDKENFDILVSSLKSERDRLQAQITVMSGASSGNIYSEVSGIFYSKVDGYENVFIADEIPTLDFDRLAELINSEPDTSIMNNAIGKIAYDYDWYLVCVAPKKKDIDYIEGRSYNIMYPFSSNKSIKSVLTKKTESVNSDEVLLIFNTMLIPDGFDFSRKQTINLVFNEVSGIRVPEEAVRVVTDENGVSKKGVYILRANIVTFRELPDNEYVGQYDGYYVYLEPSLRTYEHTGTLQLNEEIITAGKDLYDGKTLE